MPMTIEETREMMARLAEEARERGITKTRVRRPKRPSSPFSPRLAAAEVEYNARVAEVQKFLDEETIEVRERFSVPASDLYHRFVTTVDNDDPMTMTRWGRIMGELRPKARRPEGVFYRKVGLKPRKGQS